MTLARLAVLAVAALAPLALVAAGCESTQDKSARLERQAGEVKREQGLRIARESHDVKVSETAVVYDPDYGAAAVVALRNTSREALARVPIAIDVKDRRGDSLFRNDTPGLEPALTSAAVLKPGEELVWVNDQVNVADTPDEVVARVGETRGPEPKEVPRLEVLPPKLGEDPTSGVFASGYVVNDSKVEQRNLTVFCIARKGDEVVAAGRAGIKRLRPGRRGRYKVFFIGNPHGAKLELSAPPTVLG